MATASSWLASSGESGAEALLLGRRADVKGDALIHLQACERSGGRVREVADAAAWAAVAPDVATADLLVDALLGTGLRARATGPAAAGIEALVRASEAGIPVVAVDLPSGLGSDTGRVDGPAVQADLTVTFAAPKWSHVLAPACERVGELALADIGIPRRGPGAGGPEPLPRRGRGRGGGLPGPGCRRPQGQLRPRPGSGGLPREDRRRGARGHRGASERSGTGDRGDPGLVPGDGGRRPRRSS